MQQGTSKIASNKIKRIDGEKHKIMKKYSFARVQFNRYSKDILLINSKQRK